MSSRLRTAVLVVCASLHPVRAQDTGQVKNLASLDLLELREISIVSAARHEQNRTASPRSVSVITRAEIRRRGFRNVPEALAGLTGVFLQQTNYAGGSPIVRGMVGNRILIMINGIRLNNATYRLGPNQFLNQIDIHTVERIEVVRGAGSVLYGSDAFGGVINVITRAAPDPLLGAELAGAAHLRYGSADRSGSGRLEFSAAAGKAGIFGGFTRETFGDLTAGSGRQPWTGYRQWAGDLETRFALTDDKSLTFGFTRLRQFEASRTDVLAAGQDLKHEWDPQGRDMVSVRYSQGRLNRWIEALEITLAAQRPVEDLTRITAAAPNIEQRSTDEVRQVNLIAQATSRIGSMHLLSYGIEANRDRIASLRRHVNLTLGTSAAVTGNYPDGSSFDSLAWFAQDEMEMGRRLHAVLGMRYDLFRIRARATGAPIGTVDIRSHPSAVTGSGYLLYDLSPSVSAVFGISQGFRAPNLDDSTVIGGGSQQYEIPNAALLPERSTNFEYGLRLKSGKATLSAVYFSGSYRDLIDRAPALLNGLPFLDSNGNGVFDSKEPAVYQRRNIGSALVRGVEAEGVWKLSDAWTWMESVNWTHGNDTSRSAPLSRIPPLNVKSRLSWQPNPAFWTEFSLLAAAAQRRLSPGDIADIRIPAEGTPGFGVLFVRFGLDRGPLAGLSVAWENVTNQRYRFHGSGFDRPGNSVVVAYRIPFQLP